MWATVIAALSAVGAIGAAWFTRTYVKLTKEMVDQNRKAVDQTVTLAQIESKRWEHEEQERRAIADARKVAHLEVVAEALFTAGGHQHQATVVRLTNRGPHTAINVLLELIEPNDVGLQNSSDGRFVWSSLVPGDDVEMSTGRLVPTGRPMAFRLHWRDGEDEQKTTVRTIHVRSQRMA